ncbi:hypothetical protein BC477_08290 [Clavibacter michiganensis subsp. michiganensis]|uniref:Uncharacterized protein n=1 Tax=Clavibacter michiganensis subsp. michiganensis TaxID=33013 RepID=A0A251XMQ8_CLAMM|nr:hypothetical protein BC477_08290 [Clavibacter michiganensis subsp. michiganensis]OUE04721.1 hypothetical protein CMMCAS07_07220 [Clavibacter michiganensis subsp. michiganensis]
MIATPCSVLMRPIAENVMNSGIAAVTTGRACTTNSTSEYPETSFDRERLSTYPAGAAITTETSTVTSATIRLLPSQIITSVPPSTRWKFSSVKPVAVEFCPGWVERNSTARMGVITTSVMIAMSRKRHHWPFCSRCFAEVRLTSPRVADVAPPTASAWLIRCPPS